MKIFRILAILALALILISANSIAATTSVNEYRSTNGSTNDSDSGTIANASVRMDVQAEIGIEHVLTCDCGSGGEGEEEWPCMQCTCECGGNVVASAFGKAILNGVEIRADVEGSESDYDSDYYNLTVGSTAVNWFIYCHVNITDKGDCNAFADGYASITW